MDTDIFMRVLLSDKIKIEPKHMTKNFKQELTKRLKDKIEGKCTRHGFVRSNSIEIYKVNPGIIEMISLNGNIQYDIYFHADVCNPMLGSIIKAKIMNINKFGILAESGYNDPETNEFVNILEIIIAKNSVNIISDINLEEIKIGDEVRVEIMGKKYELNDKQISVVGRIVAENKHKHSGKDKDKDRAFKENDDDDSEEEEFEEELDDEEEDDDQDDAEIEEFDGEEDIDDDKSQTSKGGDLFDEEDDDGLFEEEFDMYNSEDGGDGINDDDDIE